MVSDTEIAWLAGIIDGEGCITAKYCSPRALAFRITVESVSEAMISETKQILDQLGIAYAIEGDLWRQRSTRPSCRIRVQKKEAVLRLSELILPYSVVKRPELGLVKVYLDKAVGNYYSATEEDLQICTKLQEMKKIA